MSNIDYAFQEQLLTALQQDNQTALVRALVPCEHPRVEFLGRAVIENLSVYRCLDCEAAWRQEEWTPAIGETFYPQSRVTGQVLEAHTCVGSNEDTVVGCPTGGTAWMNFTFLRMLWLYRAGKEMN